MFPATHPVSRYIRILFGATRPIDVFQSAADAAAADAAAADAADNDKAAVASASSQLALAAMAV